MTAVSIFGVNSAQGNPVVKEGFGNGLTVRAVARNVEILKQQFSTVQTLTADMTDTNAIDIALEGADAFLVMPVPQGA